MAIGSPTSLTPTVIFSLLTVTGAALGLCGAVFYLHLSQPYGMSRRRAVSDMGLPSAVSLNLILDEATPSEKYETWLLNYTEWGEGTTLSSFLAKEDHLCNQQLTKDGGMTHWVLVDADGSSQRSRTAGKARQILASCDTIRRRALVAVRSDQGQVEVKDAVAHCLFSVFCREEFRGKGYARRMMEELKKKLDDGAQDEATKPTFSVVYSDIGKSFYAYHGWETFSACHITLPTAPETRREPHANTEETDVTSVKSSDLPALCQCDEDLLQVGMQRRASLDPSQTVVALIPDIETLQWHHANEEFSGSELRDRVPTIKGAIKTTRSGKVWCVWTRVFDEAEEAENVLHILRLVIDYEMWSVAPEDEHSEVQEAIAAVLQDAQREAAEWRLHRVEMWNPQSIVVRAAQTIISSLEVHEREEEGIPSLMCHGSLKDMRKVDWVANEKYGSWF